MEEPNSYFVFETITKKKIEKLVTNLNIRKVKGFGYLYSKYIATRIKMYNRRYIFDQSIKRLTNL